MRDFANPCSVLTKSPLLLRDKDLLLEIAELRAGERVPVGAHAGREGVAGDGAAHAAPAGAARGGGRARPDRHPDGDPDRPLMPGINDGPGQVEKIVELADAAGGDPGSAAQALFLRGSTRDVFFDWLRATRPDLVERYEQLYRKGAYLSPEARGARGAAARPPAQGSQAAEQRRFDRPPRPPAVAPPKPAKEVAGGRRRCSRSLVA